MNNNIIQMSIIDKQVNKTWSVHTVENYSATQRNKVLTRLRYA